MAVPTNQTTLDNLKTALNTMAAQGGVVDVTMADGRRIKFTDMSQIVAAIASYERIVGAETADAMNKPPRTYANFGNRPH